MIPLDINSGETPASDAVRRVRLMLGTTHWLISTNGHALVAAVDGDESWPKAPEKMFDPDHGVTTALLAAPPKRAHRSTYGTLAELFGQAQRPAVGICRDRKGVGSYAFDCAACGPHGRVCECEGKPVMLDPETRDAFACGVAPGAGHARHRGRGLARHRDGRARRSDARRRPRASPGGAVTAPSEITTAFAAGEARGLEFAARLAESCVRDECSPAGIARLIRSRLAQVSGGADADVSAAPPVSTTPPAVARSAGDSSGAVDAADGERPVIHQPAGGPADAGLLCAGARVESPPVVVTTEDLSVAFRVLDEAKAWPARVDTLAGLIARLRRAEGA